MTVRYSEVISLRVSPALNEMIDQAAAKHGTKSAAWLRRAIRTSLAFDGFDMTPVVRPSTGTPRWALVARGERDRILLIQHGDKCPDISDVGHHPAGYVPSEGDVWVPVEDADTEAFDPDRHWRLVPPVSRDRRYLWSDRPRALRLHDSREVVGVRLMPLYLF